VQDLCGVNGDGFVVHQFATALYCLGWRVGDHPFADETANLSSMKKSITVMITSTT
jgi:hypothetical protein